MSFFSDPAIIGSSAMPQGADNKAPKGGLELGSALSKLLDSAAANAAKESTPELETREKPAPRTASGSFSSFVPPRSSNPDRVYSIDRLLELKDDPMVKRFDTSKVPGSAFWLCRAKNDSKGPSNAASSGTTSRRNRRSNQPNAADALSWDRKPAGFLKQSELDGMSSETISQLLGEAPDEETPEWANPGASVDMRIDMGNTVEDFERWKQRMRQEDRRKNGVAESADGDTADAPGGNDVDSFFSFVKPREARSEKPASPATKQADAKSSRFSSFFGGPGRPTPEIAPAKLPSAQSSNVSTPTEEVSGNSRFFSGSQKQGSGNSPMTQPPPGFGQRPGPPGIHPPGMPQPGVQQPGVQPGHQPGAPPGHQPGVQPGHQAGHQAGHHPPGFRQQPPGNQPPGHGQAGNGAKSGPPPPGLPVHGMTYPGMPGNANDALFMSLLNKQGLLKEEGARNSPNAQNAPPQYYYQRPPHMQGNMPGAPAMPGAPTMQGMQAVPGMQGRQGMQGQGQGQGQGPSMPSMPNMQGMQGPPSGMRVPPGMQPPPGMYAAPAGPPGLAGQKNGQDRELPPWMPYGAPSAPPGFPMGYAYQRPQGERRE